MHHTCNLVSPTGRSPALSATLLASRAVAMRYVVIVGIMFNESVLSVDECCHSVCAGG